MQILRCGWFVCYPDSRSFDGLHPCAYFETHDEAAEFASRPGVGGTRTQLTLEPGYATEAVPDDARETLHFD